MGFFKQTISSVPLQGLTVLVRADYNVPLREDGTIDDDFRIRASLPTIKKLLADNCKVVIIAHLGRPEGRDPKLSLEPAAQRLAELLGEPVRFVNQTVGDRVRMAIKRAPKRSVIVLENLRYYPEEEANDADFAKQIALSTGARYFVQDGFGVVHRAHASTDAITKCIPGVAGLLLQKEYTTITKAMRVPERPFVAVVGGAKVADKIDIITAFVKVADAIVIGGAMANTFLAYHGYAMGKSKYEPDEKEAIASIYQAVREKVGDEYLHDYLILPTDLAVAGSLDPSEPRRNVSVHSLHDEDMALDIGDQSIAKVVEMVRTAKTVIWNGTLGYAELPEFAKGSADLAQALADNTAATTIIGGGDTADFVLNWDTKKGASFTHISTGGGAGLELMAGQNLPGIESLLDA